MFLICMGVNICRSLDSVLVLNFVREQRISLEDGVFPNGRICSSVPDTLELLPDIRRSSGLEQPREAELELVPVSSNLKTSN